MNTHKQIARTVGALFITGTLAGILSVALTGQLLNGTNYLAKISANEAQLVTGALLVLTMGFSLAMIPAVLYPLFKKYNETLAIGAIIFRGALEAMAYIIIALSWLLLITINPASTGDPSGFGVLLRGVEEWTVHLLGFVFSIGALMIYWLFYISRLIPRWLSMWGLLGAVLYLLVHILGAYGIDQYNVAMAPLALQEMVLAIWLIVKGFNPERISEKVNS